MTQKASEGALVLDRARLSEHLERNPYAIVAGAFGVGFVLCGGLFTRLTARIVGAAVRAAAMSALPQLVEDLLATALGEAKAEGDPPSRPVKKSSA